MTSKIEESDSYAMLCLSLSVFYFGWFMAPPCKSRKTDALSRMNLVHFGAPVLTAIQSSTIRATSDLSGPWTFEGKRWVRGEVPKAQVMQTPEFICNNS